MKKQIIFSGKDIPYETKKLGDLFTERNERAHGDEELLSVTMANGVIRQAESDKRDMSNSDKSNYKVVHKGDIAYNTMRMWQGAEGFSKYDGIVSPAYTIVTPPTEAFGEYASILFKNPVILKEFRKHSQGMTSDTWNLKYDLFSEITISFPDDEHEQKAVSEMFHALDEAIRVAEVQVGKDKNLMESLLTSLFPQGDERSPKIRFGGYTEDWISVPLSSISEKVTKKNGDMNVTETFTNSAEYGVISQRDYFDKDISNVKNINKYYVVENNDFVYNPRISNNAPVGPIRRNRLGRSGVMSPLYTVFRTHDINEVFLEWYFKSRVWHKYMYLNGDNGARHDRFSIKDTLFFAMPIMHPSPDEQTDIANLLEAVSKRIDLNQLELQKLKDLKAAMLQRII